jgi:L-seryl-tRNA(Ser) seleniumtransferase
LGKAPLIQAVRKNPLSRIVRVGKLTLAALEATLSLFLDEALALREVPTLAMLCRRLPEIGQQAERIAAAIAQQQGGAATQGGTAGLSGSVASVIVIDGFSQMGSGSLPTQDVPTRLVAISPTAMDAGELAVRLRRGTPPVFTRVHKGQVLIDPRTLLEGEEELVVRAVAEALGERMKDERRPR